MESYIREQLEDITAQLIDGRGAIAVQITHTSQSNMSYRYKMHFVGVDTDGRAVCIPITWLVAKLTGDKLTEQLEFRGNGCGFDRRQYAVLYFLNALGDTEILDTEKYPRAHYQVRLVEL